MGDGAGGSQRRGRASDWGLGDPQSLPLICCVVSAVVCGACPVLSVHRVLYSSDVIVVSGFLLLPLCLLISLVYMSLRSTLFLLLQSSADIYGVLPACLT